MADARAGERGNQAARAAEQPWEGKRIVVTGGSGFLGHALRAQLRAAGARDQDILVPRSKDHDLRTMAACEAVARDADVIFHLAANVGGITHNLAHPAELLYDNTTMGLNLLEAARRADTSRVVLVSSACAYPGEAPVPTAEDVLWDGYPEASNAPYGVAKRVLVDAAGAYARQYNLRVGVVIPANLYGPGDTFEPGRAPVIPGLMHRFHHAKLGGAAEVLCWGDGTPTRDFLYVEDCAALLARAPEVLSTPDPVNLGTGAEVSIRRVAEAVRDVVGFEGALRWDPSKPGGQQRRALATKRMETLFGKVDFTPLAEGLRRTYASYTTTPSAAAADARDG